MASQKTSLADELEQAFQNCVTTLTSQEHFNASCPDDSKPGAEQNIHAFLEKAREVEAFFLQRRALLSVHRPEQMVKEDIQELKAELSRKDAILMKYNEKLKFWPSILQGDPSTPQPSASGTYQTMSPGVAQHPMQMPGAMAVDMPDMMQPHFPMSNAYPQGKGPLTFLEQSMSSIGMPERR